MKDEAKDVGGLRAKGRGIGAFATFGMKDPIDVCEQ